MEHAFLIDTAIIAIKENDLNKLKNIVSSIPNEKVSEIFSRQDENGDTLLLIAVNRSDIAIVRFLLEECHLDPMAKDESCMAALYVAASNGKLEIIKMLIEAGAKLNSDDAKSNCSPLHIACLYGYEKVARYLIEKGEDINKSNCLMISLVTTNEEFVKYLLECGADVNRSRLGYTPVIDCCRDGKLEILKILIQKGADPMGIYEGLSALHWAALNQQEDIIFFYFDDDYCTCEEKWDCFDLMGVASIMKEDLPSALSFWNKAMKERSHSKKIAFESSILKGLQRNSQHNEDYCPLNSDKEYAAIHSLIILERVIGIENLPLNNYFGKLLEQIDMNLEFWEAILSWISGDFINRIFHDSYSHFSMLFERHVKSCNFKNINSSILKLFYKFINVSLKLISSISDKPYILNDTEYPLILIEFIINLYSVKDNIDDFDSKWFHRIIRSFRNSLLSIGESSFHHIIDNKIFWPFSDQIIYGTFELCCKLCEPINDLNWLNESPLFFALNHGYDSKFVDILLKYGALTDIKNINGDSIREQAKLVGREDICIGLPSLQIFVNEKLNSKSCYKKKLSHHQESGDQDNFKMAKVCPAVLRNFLILH